MGLTGNKDNVALAQGCMLDIATEHAQQVRDRKKIGEEVEDEVLYFYETDVRI